MQSAFKQFLARGKSVYVHVEWISLEQAVSAITQAGGVAVIAHPRRYSFRFAQLKKLTVAFKAHGGQGIEVATPNQNADDRRLLAALCREHGLYASMGSDFHQETRYFDIGKLPALPEECPSILELLVDYL
jgi:3',5'-nucleoside bisphosphate phosphatase